jgi:hypothetical protein
MSRVAFLVLAAALAIPATAHAGWSTPVTFPAVRARDAGAQLAINARGDALALWTSRRPRRLRTTLLRATGSRTTHTLPAPRTAGEVVVALDRRGAATAAWTVSRRLYAAAASPTGRWSPRQLIAGRHAVLPTLAVARDRRVLLVWTLDSPTGAGGRTGAAWRRPGHRFAHKRLLRRPAPGLMTGELPQSDNGAVFDARGRAYVWTTCDGVVGITSPHSREFRRVRVTAGPAALSLAVTRPGRGLASWVPSRCTGDPAAGTPPGILHASLLRDGAFGPPVVLTGPDGQLLLTTGSTAFSPVATGGLVMLRSGIDVLQISLDGDGRQTGVTRTGTQSTPLAADARGNLLISVPPAGVAVRRPDGTQEAFARGPVGAQWAARPGAAGFGVLFEPDRRRLGVSLWSP